MRRNDTFTKLSTDLVDQLKELDGKSLKPSKKLRLYTSIMKEGSLRLKLLVKG